MPAKKKSTPKKSVKSSNKLSNVKNAVNSNYQDEDMVINYYDICITFIFK